MEFPNSVAKIFRREIRIFSQNMIQFLKFFIKHPSFGYNQIYKFSCVYNANENQVYNEIHTSK